MHHEALLVRGIQNCNSPEFPAVVSTFTAFSGTSVASHLGVPEGNSLALERQNSAPTVPFSDNHFGLSPDFLSSFVSVRPSVLRI